MRDDFLIHIFCLVDDFCSVHNKLKNSCQIEHHRHRSPLNFLVNLLSGLIAYCKEPEKPSLHIEQTDKALIYQIAA